MPCFYCQRQLTRPGRQCRPTDATREHLRAISNGGGDAHSNVVAACRECNVFVDNWPVELKLAFRRLLREEGRGIMAGLVYNQRKAFLRHELECVLAGELLTRGLPEVE